MTFLFLCAIKGNEITGNFIKITEGRMSETQEKSKIIQPPGILSAQGKKIKDEQIIFKPNPGSQEMFLSCPVFEVLLSGTRGSGKTLVLIMDFLKDIGKGWGPSWIGVIFRQTYKQLFDVITKTKEWVPRIFPQAKFVSSEAKWVFPNGEQLLFRYMEREDDYWQYHGWEVPWCVSPRTLVLLPDGNYKRIGDIKEGDYVRTLQGNKRVLKKLPLKTQKLTRMFVVDRNKRLIGMQEQGYSHSVLGGAVNFIGNPYLRQRYSFCVSKKNQETISDFCSQPPRPFGTVLYKGEISDQVREERIKNGFFLETDGLDDGIEFMHPYSGSLQRANEFNGSIGGVFLVKSKQKINMIDMHIEDNNHYITKLQNPSEISYRVLKQSKINFVENYWNMTDKDNPFIKNPYHVINKNCAWEELTNFATSDMYDTIKSICRSPNKGIPKRYRSTTNPFGIGAGWVKERFIDVAEPYEIYVGETGEERCWIDSHILENKPFLEADPHYLQRLGSSMKDKNKLKAWTTGSWDISVGGFFSDVWDAKVHKIEPFEIPQSWYIDVTYDYGSSKPFAILFFAECTNDEEVDVNGVKRSFIPGTLFLIVEYYGWTGKADEGLRMNVTDIAKETRSLIEDHYLLKDHEVHPGAADNSIFISESNVPSIALRMLKFKDEFGHIKKGIRWKRSNKKPGSRKIGAELFRGMLMASEQIPQEEPGFFVFKDCRNFLRTVPALPRSRKDPDDISGKSEDHIWDATRYRILSKKATTVSQEV